MLWEVVREEVSEKTVVGSLARVVYGEATVSSGGGREEADFRRVPKPGNRACPLAGKERLHGNPGRW